MDNNFSIYETEVYQSEFKKLIGDIYHPAVITTYDYINPVILYANKLHKDLTEWDLSEILFKSPKMFQPEFMDIEIKRNMKSELESKKFFNGDLINITKSNKVYIVNVSIFGVVCEINGASESFYVALKTPTLNNC